MVTQETNDCPKWWLEYARSQGLTSNLPARWRSVKANLLVTAHHEAAHAVVCLVLAPDVILKAVTIDPQEYFRRRGTAGAFTIEYETERHDYRIRIAYAGYQGDRLAWQRTGMSVEDRAATDRNFRGLSYTDDRNGIRDAISKMEAEKPVWLLQSLRRWVETLFRDPSIAIATYTISDKLLESGTLSGEQCDALVEAPLRAFSAECEPH